MNEMILQEKKEEINREFEIYLQLQKGLQEMQPAQENLQNLFEIEDLLKRTDDEQLINTIYLHLTKQFHHFNQNNTAEAKFCKVFNKKEVLDMFQDHIRSLDQMTRTISIKIVGVLTPFYLESIETFHLIIDILLKSDYHEEIKSCIHLLGNFVEGGGSNQSALRLLVKGEMILNKCGEGVYLDLLNRVKLHNRVIQITYYKQIIALICTNSGSSLRRKLKLIIRVCRSNYELAADFFHFCEENFDQFSSEEPQFINKHLNQTSASQNDSFGEGGQFLSQTLIKLSAKSKSFGQSNSIQNQNFNQKLKNFGKSLSSILEKKVKSAALEKRQSSLIEAVSLIYKWSKHFNVTPSYFLNEKIVKSLNKYNLYIIQGYIHTNEDVDKSEIYIPISNTTESLNNPNLSSKSILISIHNLVKSDERRRCLNILEMDDYDSKYIEKNFYILQQVTPQLTSPNDSALLFRSFSNTFHKLSFQIMSKNHEFIREFHEKHYAKFLCLIAFLSPLRCHQIYQIHIMNLLKERVFKIYLTLFHLSIGCPFYNQFFNIVNLTLCLLYNKLIDKDEIKRMISNEFIMNINLTQSFNDNPISQNKKQLKLLKRIAYQFAVFNIYEQSYLILSIVKENSQRINCSTTLTRDGDECESSLERIEFQMKLLSLLQRIDKQDEEKSLLQLYDILLFFSRESFLTFETHFMEFFYPTNDENRQIINQQIQLLLSNKFNIDSSSKATIRFIVKLLNCVDKVSNQQNDSQNKMVDEFNQQMNNFEFNLADSNSRYHGIDDEDEMQQDDEDINDNFQFDFYIDGRQIIIEKITLKPNLLLKILQNYPLILPRSLFVQQQQPHLSIQILPLTEYSMRAEKGCFLQGQIKINNLIKGIEKNKLQLNVDLKQEIQPSECIQKHISTTIQIIKNKPSPKIFSESLIKKNSAHDQNTKYVPFSALVLFPYIGQFNITLKVDLICCITGEIILSSFSQLVQINAL